MRTQKDAILSELKIFGYVTSWQAFNTFGITRLSAIIHNLRREGYNIINVTRKFTNRYGHKSHYVEYKLVH